MFLLCALIAGSGSVWATDVVVTLDNIGAGLGSTANTTAATTDITATGTTDSYILNYYQCKKQGNAILMTKSVNPYISNKTAMPGNIKSVEVFINSGAAGKTTYDCAFSTTECTSATSGIGAVNITGGNSHTFSNLTGGSINVQGKYFCITLGNANNGQVLKLVITCESSDPIINATNPNDLAYDATNGVIEYEIGNYEGGSVTADTEADWISNFNYNEANKIGFTTSVNNGITRTATVTLTLKNASNETLATKNVTITQTAIPPMVTINAPTGGSLVVKNGEATITSGDRVPVGTQLTIEATADGTHKYSNWQYKKGTGNWTTKYSNFTYTMDENDVEFRATFDLTYVVSWSVNGTVVSTTRFAKDEIITLADAPADIDGRTFVGWAEGTINGTTNEAPTFLTEPVMGTSDVTYYAVFASKELGENISATFKASDKSNLTKDANAYLYTENETGITLSSTSADNTSFDVTTGNYYEITVDGYFTSIAATVYSSHQFSSTSAGTLTTSGSTQTITFGENDEVSTVRLTNNESNESWISQFVVNAVGYSYVDYCTTVVPDTRKIVNITGFSATTSPIVRGNTSTTTVTNDQDGWTPAYTYLSDNTDVATVDENGEITAVAKGTANITVKLNVSKDDTEYKAGTTKSMSIEITVVNPSHDVVFYDNGTHLDTYDESYEEGDEIIFPDDPSIDGYYFIGWATDAIDGTTDEAPATVTAATMGNADVTYYAVYAIQTVGADEKFEYYKNTGSTGTSGGITVSGTTNSTASNGNPSPSFNTSSATIQISGLNLSSYSSASMKFDFKAGKVNGAFTTFTIKQFDSTNTELTSNTVTGTQNSSYVTSNEISVNVNCTKLTIAATAAKDNSFVDNIIVYAIRPGITYSGYRTSLTATISIASACTDGDMYYGTYSNSCAFIVSDDIIVSEISIVDGKLYVDDYESGDIVPANTGVMVSAMEGGNYTVTLTSGGTSILGDDNCLRPSGDGGITAAAMSEAAANCLYYRLTMHGADPVNNIPGTIGFWWGAADGAAFSLAANKAYLAVPNEQETARMGFAFGDNTQGIDDVKRETITNDRYYNLQGQRISDIHKVSPNKGGLYIVNGKKVILK